MSYHYFTHCALRLGDNLAHLHFLRGMAKAQPNAQFVHFAHERYLPQLQAVVYDLPRIALMPLRHAPNFGPPNPDAWWLWRPGSEWNSVDAWKNAGGYFDRHEQVARESYATFMLGWFHELARRMGFSHGPFTEPEHLLFDYPAVLQECGAVLPRTALVVNSPPQSGQVPDFSSEVMDAIMGELAPFRPVVCTSPTKVQGVACTQDISMSVTQIGRMANSCAIVLCVSTGPSWPTYNTLAASKRHQLRISICQERVDLLPRMEHFKSPLECLHWLRRPEIRQIIAAE